MATAKKKTTSKSNTVSAPTPYHENKSVRITKAENGFTVSCYGSKGEETRIATSLAAATKHAKAMMDSK